jgi:hypothetical protein
MLPKRTYLRSIASCTEICVPENSAMQLTDRAPCTLFVHMGVMLVVRYGEGFYTWGDLDCSRAREASQKSHGGDVVGQDRAGDFVAGEHTLKDRA